MLYYRISLKIIITFLLILSLSPSYCFSKNYPDKNLFVWPVDGPVSSPFGNRHGFFHNGIDILPGEGRLSRIIKSTQSGKVVFAKDAGNFGKLIIIQHSNKLKSYYAHLANIYVEWGQVVQKGQIIGRMGSSGRSTAVHLHFEIRKMNKPVNPLNYLR